MKHVQDVDCVFCEIVAGRVPASVVFQDALTIHPRFKKDGVLQVYPHTPATPDKQKRDGYAALLRQHLEQDDLAL